MGKHLRDERDSKNMVYIFGGALFLSIVVFIAVFNTYDSSLKKEAAEELYSLEMKNAIVSNEDLKSVSSDLSALVKEVSIE